MKKSLFICLSILIFIPLNSCTEGSQVNSSKKETEIKIPSTDLPVKKNEELFFKAKNIIEQKCNICHSPNATLKKEPPYFNTNSKMKRYAKKIKFYTSISKSMPPKKSVTMTDEERQLIAEWVDQGAK